MITYMKGIKKEEIKNKTIKIIVKWSDNNTEHESHSTLKKNKQKTGIKSLKS